MSSLMEDMTQKNCRRDRLLNRFIFATGLPYLQYTVDGSWIKANKNLVLDSKPIKHINKQVGKFVFNWKRIVLVTN